MVERAECLHKIWLRIELVPHGQSSEVVDRDVLLGRELCLIVLIVNVGEIIHDRFCGLISQILEGPCDFELNFLLFTRNHEIDNFFELVAKLAGDLCPATLLVLLDHDVVRNVILHPLTNGHWEENKNESGGNSNNQHDVYQTLGDLLLFLGWSHWYFPL